MAIDLTDKHAFPLLSLPELLVESVLGFVPQDFVCSCTATFLRTSRQVARLVMQQRLRRNMKEWALEFAATYGAPDTNIEAAFRRFADVHEADVYDHMNQAFENARRWGTSAEKTAMIERITAWMRVGNSNRAAWRQFCHREGSFTGKPNRMPLSMLEHFVFYFIDGRPNGRDSAADDVSTDSTDSDDDDFPLREARSWTSLSSGWDGAAPLWSS